MTKTSGLPASIQIGLTHLKALQQLSTTKVIFTVSFHQLATQTG